MTAGPPRLDAATRTEAVLGALLAAVLLGSTLGEGGAAPAAVLGVHAAIAVLLGVAVTAGPARWMAARRPLALGALFVFTVVVGAAMAPYAYAAVSRLLGLACVAIVAGLAVRVGPTLPGRLVPALAVGLWVQAAIVVYVRVADGDARPAGTFLNPNHLAAWSVAAGLLALGGAVGGRVSVRLAAATAVPAAAILFQSGSRGALLGAAAGSAWLLASAWKRLEGRRRAAVAATVAALVVLAVAGIAVRSRGYDPFRYHRVKIWAAALHAAYDRPWTGVGPGQWEAAANRYSFPVEEGPLRFERIVDSTHSDLVRLPAELGWPAAAVALVAVAGLALELAGRRGTAPAGHAGAVAALVALGAHACVDNLSERPAVCLLAAALAGSLVSRPRPAPAPPRVPLRAAAVVAVLFAVGVAEVAPFAAWRLQSGLPRGRLSTEDRARLERAVRLNPIHPDSWRRRAEHLVDGGGDWTPADYAAARDDAEHAVRLQPADARYRIALARVEALAFGTLFGDAATRARAAASYRDAATLAPHDPAIHLELGGFLLRASDRAGARRAAEAALSIEPRSLPARLLLAESLLADGEIEAAARILDGAERIDEEWAAYPVETDYARFHLRLDRARVAAIRAPG